MIVVMQIWDGDKDLSVHTARAIREKLPSAKIGVLANKCEHPKELEEFCDIIQTTTDDLHLAGGLALHELLVLALRMSGSFVLKVDPDCSFGTPDPNLEEVLLKNSYAVQGRIYSLVDGQDVFHHASGGFFGLGRATARRIVDEGILLSQSLIVPSKMLEAHRHKFRQYYGHGSHSWPLALACRSLGIPHLTSTDLEKLIGHPPLEAVSPSRVNLSDIEAQRVRLGDSSLVAEILGSSPEEIGLKSAEEFVSMIWGSSGISIAQRQDESTPLQKNNPFSDLQSLLASLRTGVFQHNVISAKPIEESGIGMIVLNVDHQIDCEVSMVATSFNSRQLFLTMQEPISSDAANKLIDEASFADKRGSRASTLLYGVRLPGTACYEDICLHRSDSDICDTKKVLSDEKVRLVKFVDKFFTYDEALAVIRGLAESYKVPPPVMEPEPALP
jgi:hypothetical protein